MNAGDPVKAPYSKKLGNMGHKLENLFASLKDGVPWQHAMISVPISFSLPSCSPLLSSSGYA